MYYIICEGEENKSEYKFVKAVVTLYANNKPLVYWQLEAMIT